jgi:hypothetical protein
LNAARSSSERKKGTILAGPFCRSGRTFGSASEWRLLHDHNGKGHAWTHGGMVGVNVGIPVPLDLFGFTGHKNSFFGDRHIMGTDAVRFFTELKTVTSHWFS